jgi:hypothetical protein
MELPHRPSGSASTEPTPRREALRLIVEVFRDGQQAAADLRERIGLDGMTPMQLERELAAIETMMLAQISNICRLYGQDGEPVHWQ